MWRRSMAAAEVALLTDDLLVEILARVPYRSLCRFKSVSKRWRCLIADPDHRHLLPRYHLHPLAGFLHRTRDSKLRRSSLRLTDVVDATKPPPLGIIDPSASLSFLTKYDGFSLLDSCNGLVLCHCLSLSTCPCTYGYVVCNPATGLWVVLPQSGCRDMMLPGPAYLGFDPAVSCSHFHVFRFVDNLEGGSVIGVWIYSSETGHWVHKDNGWDHPHKITYNCKSLFFDGMLHLITDESAIAAMDAEGNTWRDIRTPGPNGALKFVGLYDGSLCFAKADENRCEVSIWVLGSRGEEWIWKHTISNVHQHGLTNVHLVHDCNIKEASSTHPAGKCSMVFLVFEHEKLLLSYGIDSGEVHSTFSLGHDSYAPYLPYLPVYSDSLADGE